MTAPGRLSRQPPVLETPPSYPLPVARGAGVHGHIVWRQHLISATSFSLMAEKWAPGLSSRLQCRGSLHLRLSEPHTT